MTKDPGPKTAEQIINNLHNFNRKERDHLMKFALSESPDYPEISENLWDRIAPNGPGSEKPDKAKMFIGMDYHLNWLFAALKLSEKHTSSQLQPQPNTWPESLKDKPSRPPIQDNQEDVDLLVAFRGDGNTLHLVLIEAKFDTGWGSKQFRSKAQRLNAIKAVTDEYNHLNVEWKFVLASPSHSGPARGAFAPSSLSQLPDWISQGAGEAKAVPHIQFGPGKLYHVKRVEGIQESPWEVLPINLRGRSSR